jgi:uncharacterized HAD superfamily protein
MTYQIHKVGDTWIGNNGAKRKTLGVFRNSAGQRKMVFEESFQTNAPHKKAETTYQAFWDWSKKHEAKLLKEEKEKKA